MKKAFLLLLLSAFICARPVVVMADDEDDDGLATALQNIERAMELVDGVMSKTFSTDSDGDYIMGDEYIFLLGTTSGNADVWPYTAVIEAVNGILEALNLVQEAAPELYEENYDRYVDLLNDLYSSMDHYSGTFKLVSYTNTATWTVYGVHYSSTAGSAAVEGVENVYDDQMWIVRELLRAYNLTGSSKFLRKAETLVKYILDGWDTYLKTSGEEYGGITWGPGYNSKHACSNSPIISPLVWLYDLYKDSESTTTHYFINSDNSRGKETVKKSDYYLEFAEKVYDWQKSTLYNSSTGCFYDMCGATTGTIQYEEVDGVTYRKHVSINGASGTEYTYNTGTMLAGAVDLYLATGDEYYLEELTALAKDSYTNFRGTRTTIDDETYYPFPYDESTTSGFNAWFNNVLLRAYVDAYPYDDTTDAIGREWNYASLACSFFQKNLDYAYENYLQDGFLPNNLLGGWDSNVRTKGFHQVAYASEYAKLAFYQYSGSTTKINKVKAVEADDTVDVYTIDGRKVRSNVAKDVALDGLQKGTYIVGGEKHLVR